MQIKALATFMAEVGDETITVRRGQEVTATEAQARDLIKSRRAVEVTGKAAGSDAGAPDYDRDNLRDLALPKATKDQLLVIAAYEKADAPNADGHTVAELRKAIEAKRKAVTS